MLLAEYSGLSSKYHKMVLRKYVGNIFSRRLRRETRSMPFKSQKKLNNQLIVIKY